MNGGMSYEEVMRRIGSKTPTVRRHYISYRLLLQMMDCLEDFSVEEAQGPIQRNVPYKLRTHGDAAVSWILTSLQPQELAKLPIPQTRLDALSNFSRWIFGSQDRPPLFSDSRRIDDFGRILESPKAIEYLEGNN